MTSRSHNLIGDPERKLCGHVIQTNTCCCEITPWPGHLSIWEISFSSQSRWIGQLLFGSPGTHGEAKVCNSVSSHGKWSKRPQSEEYPVTSGGRHPCLLLRPLPKALQGYARCTPLYLWRQSLELLIKPNKTCGWGVPLAYHFSCHLFKIKLFEISDQKGVVSTNHYHVI